MELVTNQSTLTASWKNRTVISIPKSSPAILVNLEMMFDAFNVARRISKTAVQTHTLLERKESSKIKKLKRMKNDNIDLVVYSTILPRLSRVSDPVQACLC